MVDTMNTVPVVVVDITRLRLCLYIIICGVNRRDWMSKKIPFVGFCLGNSIFSFYFKNIFFSK